MTKSKIIFAALALTLQVSAKTTSQQQPKEDELIFREPFTLKLHVDKEHYYEQKMAKIPYLYKKDIYLFSGESFGVNVQVVDGEIVKTSYQKELEKADIHFHFTQEKLDNGTAMMMLKIQSKLSAKLYLKARMTIPQKKGIYKTSILPVHAGKQNYETWPHPIVQLVLYDLSLKEPVQIQK